MLSNRYTIVVADRRTGVVRRFTVSLRAVLGGAKGPYRHIVLLNAGAALLVAGKAKTLRDGVALAAQSIDSGKALGVLDALVPLSHGKV